MRIVDNLAYLSTMLCSFIVFFALSGCDSVSSTSASDFLSTSEKVKGVVLIESPQMGSLLYLRGIAGKGTLTFSDSMSNTTNERQGKRQCISAPIRFAAGDFGGSGIGINNAKSIRLLIYSDEIMKKLILGEEIISEDYVVTDRNTHNASEQGSVQNDINIESGLTLDYGFVLNPGEWSWSSLFGQNQKKVDCGWLGLN